MCGLSLQDSQIEIGSISMFPWRIKSLSTTTHVVPFLNKHFLCSRVIPGVGQNPQKKNPENSMDVGCWDTVLHVPNGFPMGFPLGKHCSPMSFPPARPAMTTPPITETMIPRRATKAAPCARPSPRLLAMRMPTLSPMAMENRKAKISTVITWWGCL